MRSCAVDGRTVTVLLDPDADIADFRGRAAPHLGGLRLTILGGMPPIVEARRRPGAAVLRELAPAGGLVGLAAIVAGVLLGSPTSRLLEPAVPEAVRGAASTSAVERVIVQPATRTVVAEAPRGSVLALGSLESLSAQAPRSNAPAPRALPTAFPTARPGAGAAGVAATNPGAPVAVEPAPAQVTAASAPASAPEKTDDAPRAAKAKPERDRDGGGTMSATSSPTKNRKGGRWTRGGGAIALDEGTSGTSDNRRGRKR